MKHAVRIAVRLVLTSTFMAVMFAVPKTFAWSAPQTRMTDLISISEGTSAKLPFPATHVVVRWSGASDASVQVRGLGQDGVWQEWLAAEAESSEEPARPVEDNRDSVVSETAQPNAQESGIITVDNVTELQVRVLAGDATDLHVAGIDTENGPRHLEAVTTTGAKAEALGGLTPQPAIITRSQWGADESLRKGTPEFAPIKKLIVHHTVTSNTDANPAATVRAIYAWHTQGNGWNDIGYNFLIDANGNVYEGRYARNYGAGEAPTAENAGGLGVIGAHSEGSNVGSIGIALLGTFSTQQPSAAQQNALTRLLAWESDRHGINPTAQGSIVGHRDVYQTECPGDAAYALLPQWRQQASATMTLSFPIGNTPGYTIAHNDGAISAYGSARNFGSMAGKPLNAGIVSMTSTTSSNGYWLLGGDGGIFSFGDARFYGSTGNMRLNAPIVGMASTKSGNGYWLLGADGGIFSFGDAKFFGSTGSIKLNKPVVGMAATPSGNGYWLVASDGGVFSFGDAAFHGSTGSLTLNSPVTTIAPSPKGNGYWLMAGDGGVFSFDTPFMGSIPMLGLRSFGGVAQAAPTSTGSGYYVLARDGGVYTFGDAKFWGAPSGHAASSISVLPE